VTDESEQRQSTQLRILLDTNAFLWAIQEPETLEEAAREAIADPDTEVYVSSAVAWEIAIKHAKGNLPLPLAPLIYVPSRMKALGFIDLPITQEHALAVSLLPAIHADPFDRIMIAQAQVEGLALVTRDARVLRYSLKTIQA
jgi:PIN domain nuclease of toxin-antitoxin system